MDVRQVLGYVVGPGATYPEAVKIAALVGSLHWRRLAASDPLGQRRFAVEIGRRLGQPDYSPKAVADPIAHWIDDDCWRRPSLPRTTYHTLRGYGGHTIPKVNQHSIDRHRRSAAGSATTAAADAPSSITATSARSSPHKPNRKSATYSWTD